jgi:carboxyl-terminal processing protease
MYLKSWGFVAIGFFSCLILGSVFWFFMGYSLPIQPAEGVDLSVFWEAWSRLEENYIHSDEINQEQMIQGAIAGMVSSLEDPHTVFLNPQESTKFKEDLAGEIEGVGMEIGLRNGYITIIAPLKETPAEKAGLRAGDQILKIDENSAIGITVEKAVELIRGQKNTEVTLSIKRIDVFDEKDFVLIRDVIQIPSVSWELIDGDIAHVHIHHFHEGLINSFRNTSAEILKSSAKGIILDLRNNPGGYLDVAVDIAGWFLPRDEIVAIEEFADSRQEFFYTQGNNAKLSYYPLIIIINQGSASGSEILAGALRDNRNIIIVGENSFGKGSVQQTFNLKDGSLVKITIAKWLTPKGYLIDGLGLDPDITIEIDQEDYIINGEDTQLEKAIEILRDVIQ